MAGMTMDATRTGRGGGAAQSGGVTDAGAHAASSGTRASGAVAGMGDAVDAGHAAGTGDADFCQGRPRGRVLVAMSGGVDSSVTAHLLLEAGFDCVGATMQLYDASTAGRGDSCACENARDIEEAAALAARLGIPHHVIDCREEFDNDVIERFVRAYEDGLTPNPCVLCNQRLKFGKLFDVADELGCDYIATGHYARVLRRTGDGPLEPTAGHGGEHAASRDFGSSQQGEFVLAKGIDQAKDQSYFLYTLTPEKLARTLFPLGGLTKDGDVRRIAEEQGFACAKKNDSQGICFVPDNDFASFIELRRGRELPAGDIVNEAGEVLGRHRGAIRYTIGQRKGLGVALAHPVFVTRIDARANTVVLGESEDLEARGLIAGDWVWSVDATEMERAIDAAGSRGVAVSAKVRYRQPDQEARLFRGDKPGEVAIEFAQNQRAIAPGQAVVVYEGSRVLGGGTALRAVR